MCFAQNDFGHDQMAFHLLVQGLNKQLTICIVCHFNAALFILQMHQQNRQI